MTAIPAIIAGVGEIIICSPPGVDGRLNDILLYLCRDLGISEIYKIGGAQAVAAMAFGTGRIVSSMTLQYFERMDDSQAAI